MMVQKRILFVTHDSKTLGSNHSLVNMISSLTSNKVFVFTVFPSYGPICEIFERNGWNFKVLKYHNELHSNPKNIFYSIKILLKYYFIRFINFLMSIKLKKLIKKHQINLIHTNSSVVAIGSKVANEMRIKHVWHLREYIHPNYNLFVYGGLENYKKKIAASESYFISITLQIAKYFNVDNKSIVLWDAVRKFPKYADIQKKGKYFLFCGTLLQNKGVEEAIQAFFNFSLEYSGYHLYIVGVGSLEYEIFLKNKILNLGITSNVKFLGYRDDIDELMAKASALLMCSRNEALGRVTIEAMLNFCIVIGYNDSGTAEIIMHNNTGILYNNPNELVQFMKNVVSNPDHHTIILKQAYDFARINFLERNYAHKILDFYETL